jgi:outer membrane receptor protein involved in Fe transport
MNTNYKSLALALAVATGSLTTPILAEDLNLEEIIVTAQKRAESLQDVPISIASVSGEALEKAIASNLARCLLSSAVSVRRGLVFSMRSCSNFLKLLFGFFRLTYHSLNI